LSAVLKFLVDVGVGKIAEVQLMHDGHDVMSVRDLDPRMKDRDILQLAVEEQCIVITMDKDFGELVYREGLSHVGIVLFRMEDATGHEKAAVLHTLLAQHADKIQGHFCVYQNGRLRIR
jgi:predicted nuclease of predicted toxin-antitoxin system